MELLVVQLLCLAGLFLSMLLLTFLPFKLAKIGQNSSTESECFPPKYTSRINLANCISGGVFLATFFVGLLPEVRREIKEVLKIARISSSIPVTEVLIVLGFFLAVFVEQIAITIKDATKNHTTISLTTGEDSLSSSSQSSVTTNQDFAHHHGHSHDVEVLFQTSGGLKFGILLLSLGVHSLFEGMALGLQDNVHTLINLFIGVWIHECLIAFALGFSTLRIQMTACRRFQVALLFSSLIPAGQIIGMVIGSGQSLSSRSLAVILQAIAAGTFVQVTFFDIIPDGLGQFQRNNRMLKVFLLFFGFISISSVTFYFQISNERDLKC